MIDSNNMKIIFHIQGLKFEISISLYNHVYNNE